MKHFVYCLCVKVNSNWCFDYSLSYKYSLFIHWILSLQFQIYKHMKKIEIIIIYLLVVFLFRSLLQNGTFPYLKKTWRKAAFFCKVCVSNKGRTAPIIYEKKNSYQCKYINNLNCYCLGMFSCNWQVWGDHQNNIPGWNFIFGP